MEGSRETVLAGRTLVPGCLFLGWNALQLRRHQGMLTSWGVSLALQRVDASSLAQPASQCVFHIPSWCLPGCQHPLAASPNLRHQNELLCQQTTRHTPWTQPQGQERASLDGGCGSEARDTWCSSRGLKPCSQHPHLTPHNCIPAPGV